MGAVFEGLQADAVVRIGGGCNYLASAVFSECWRQVAAFGDAPGKSMIKLLLWLLLFILLLAAGDPRAAVVAVGVADLPALPAARHRRERRVRAVARDRIPAGALARRAAGRARMMRTTSQPPNSSQPPGV